MSYIRYKLFFYHQIFLILTLLEKIITECPRNAPIQTINGCELTYCNSTDFKSGSCVISNNITKTQWLTNIIMVGGNDFRYVNFANNSNGDLIMETSACPGNNKRIFFCLKTDNSYCFGNTPFKLFEVSGQEGMQQRYESEIQVIKLSDNKNNSKEYILSITKSAYSELYDLESGTIYQSPTSDFISLNVKALISVLIPLQKIDDNFYYLFANFYKPDSKHRLFLFRKYMFLSENIAKKDSYTIINEQTADGDYNRIVSCFQTVSSFIVCFFTYDDNNLAFAIFDKNVTETTILKYKKLNSMSDFIFLKGIHFKDDVGSFAFYINDNSNFKLYISFRKFYETQNSYGSDKYINSVDTIYINKAKFTEYCMLNDFIKFSDNKVCLSTTTESKERLYLVILNLYDNDSKYVIRYYIIELFQLYHYKFLKDMKLHLFNDYIAFGFSYCNQETCENDTDNHYSSLMIFSYPNSTNNSIDIIDYLYYNNEVNILNIEFSPSDNIIIENNIFGYELEKIKIIEINDNDNEINFVSDIKNNTIKINDFLTKEEKLKIVFRNEKEINTGNYWINFSSVIKEPDYEMYIQYPESTDNLNEDQNEKNYYNPKLFNGRVASIKYIIKNNLTFDCDEECNLCLKNKTDYCVTCKGDYIFSNDNKEKKCILKTEYEEEYENEEIEEKIEKKETEKELIEEIKEIEKEINFEGKGIIEFKEEELTEKICFFDELITNLCSNQKISSDQYKDTYVHLKNKLLSINLTNNETITNEIIETRNVIFEITTLGSQPINENISTISLENCETLLKIVYGISNIEDLIIIKTDTISDDSTSRYVQYEVYNPKTLEKINVSICDQVEISYPVNLDDDVIELYESLSNSGYNLFDENDSFYNDICTPYTSQNGIDVPIFDRTDLIKSSENLTLCQENCEYEYYNVTTKKIVCSCNIQNHSKINTDLDEINDLFDNATILSHFIIPLKYSNFLVLKCYKLALSSAAIINNYGSYIMICMVVLFTISMIVYCCTVSKNVKNYIDLIIAYKRRVAKNKYIYSMKKFDKSNNNTKNTKSKIIRHDKKNINNKNNYLDKKALEKKKIEFCLKPSFEKTENKKRRSLKNSTIKKEPPKKERKVSSLAKEESEKSSKTFSRGNTKRTISDLNNKNRINIYIKRGKFLRKNKKELTLVNNKKYTDSKKDKRNTALSTVDKSSVRCISLSDIPQNDLLIKNTNINKKIGKNKQIIKNDSNKITKLKSKAKKNCYINNNNITKFNSKNANFIRSLSKYYENVSIKNREMLNDFELNSLPYNEAIMLDKRSYFQYYISLLKLKHLIIFTFFNGEDYNFKSVKISLFILFFSLFFTINAFFFTDTTMHNIYINYGKLDFVYRIPKIMYSSLASFFMKSLLNILALTQKNFLDIKNKSTFKESVIYADKVQNGIELKYFIYFNFGYIIIIFFWYYITCFCAIYANTQIILIKDTLYSFGISLFYPIGLYLIPGVFRMPAIRSKSKDKKCLYTVSALIAAI